MRMQIARSIRIARRKVAEVVDLSKNVLNVLGGWVGVRSGQSHEPTELGIRVARVWAAVGDVGLPRLQHAIVVRVRNRRAEDDGAVVWTAATRACWRDGNRLRKIVGLDD